MALTIEPASATIAARDTQLFAAQQNGQSVPAEWEVVGQGTIGKSSGIYTAPNVIFISKNATVVAKAGQEEGAATVVVSAAHTWIPVLSAYLSLAAVALLASLYLYWGEAKPGKIAFLAGGLGACLHGINSLVAYVGNRQFASSWAPFYLFRPFAGGILAIIVLWVLRGGLAENVVKNGDSVYTVAAVAGLVGLFSDIALKKLEDIVKGLFSSVGAMLSGERDKRTDKLNTSQAAKPVISGTDPKSLKADGRPQALEISGTGLVAGSRVKVNGNVRKITSETPPSKLVIELEAADVQAPGKLKLVVESPQGPTSDEFIVEVA